jgi:hypothetical protein
MSKYNKEELENLILIQNLSYEAIGRLYGVTGNAVKKAASRLGIDLPSRRKINPCETFNKDTSRIARYCLNCGKELDYSAKKYCSNDCQAQYEYTSYIERWKNGEESGVIGKYATSKYIRKYLFNKYSDKCQKCGWGEINPSTGLIPLQIHHKDGNCVNNSEDNLELLCPNCHSLTETYGSLNVNSSRVYRRQKEGREFESHQVHRLLNLN